METGRVRCQHCPWVGEGAAPTIPELGAQLGTMFRDHIDTCHPGGTEQSRAIDNWLRAEDN